jgi:protein TonB
MAFVVLLHVGIVAALANGLATRVIEVMHPPVDAKVIAQAKKPPPPLEPVIPPPPRFEAPPPPYIPPPEVRIAAPPPPPDTIRAVTSTPPPQPVAIAPVPPPAPAPAAPPAPRAPPARMAAGVVCANYATIMGSTSYPREAVRAGLDHGDALVQFTVTADGTLKDVHVVKASDPIFARNSERIVSRYRCQGQGHDVVVQVPFGYRLE